MVHWLGKTKKMAKRTATKTKTQETPVVEAPKPKTLMEQVKTNISRVKEAFHADPLFRDDPTEVETPTAVAAWAMLDTLGELIEKRKASYRLELLTRSERDGVPTDKGGNRLWCDDSEVLREKRQNKLPEESDFRLLLLTKGISFTEAFDEVKTLKMNPSKIDYLIQTGRITQAEVDEYRKTTYAMKVKQSELLEKVLDDYFNVMLGQPLGTKRLKEK